MTPFIVAYGFLFTATVGDEVHITLVQSINQLYRKDRIAPDNRWRVYVARIAVLRYHRPHGTLVSG